MRFKILDALRGVAAMMVAVFHFDVLHHFYAVPLLRHGFLWVDFFFVLSGFVIAHAYTGRLEGPREAASFLVRRFGRVWPLHAVILLAFAAFEGLKLVTAGQTGRQGDFVAFADLGGVPLLDLPAQLTLTHALNVLPRLTWNYPSWSISAEFWAYVVFAAVALATPPRRRLWGLAGLGLAAMALLLAFSKDGINASYDLGLARCLASFAAGAMVHQLRSVTPAARKCLIGSAELPMLAAIILFIWTAGASPLSFASPAMFAAAVYVFSFEGGPVSLVLAKPAFQELGRRSYSIYMVQAPVAMIMNSALTVLVPAPAGHDHFTVMAGGHRVMSSLDPFAFDGLLVAYLVAVVVLAGLTYRAIEIPGQRLFNGWSGLLSPGDLPGRRPRGLVLDAAA